MTQILRRKIKICIPSIYKEAIDRTNMILTKEFGVATNYHTEGTWLDAEGELIKENVTVIQAGYTEELIPEFLMDLARDLDEELNPYNAAIEIEGEMIEV